MATLTIDGQRITIDDKFLSLPMEEKNRVVEEIHQSFAPKAAPVTAGGLAKAGLTGLQEGVTSILGIPGDIQSAIQGKVKDWTGIEMPAVPNIVTGGISTQPTWGSGDIQSTYESMGGPVHRPENVAEEYARTAGNFVPNMIGGAASLPTKVVTRVAIPAAISETAGQATKGTAYEPYARAGGAFAGGFAGAGLEDALTASKTAALPTVRDTPQPTQLKAAAEEGYKQFRAVPLEVKGSAVKSFGAQLENELVNEGLMAADAPSTYNVINLLKSGPDGGFQTPANFHSVTKALGRAMDNTSPDRGADRAAAAIAMDRLKAWFKNLTEDGLQRGTSADLAKAKLLFDEANGNYAAFKRSQLLTGKLRSAELSTSAANSGQNLDNAIRRRMANIAAGNKETRGFIQSEVKGMEGIVEGSGPTNAARLFGNMLGGGGGIGVPISSAAGAGGGFFAGGPIGAFAGSMLPTVGFVLKQAENALSRNAMNALEKSTRARSPLYNSMPVLPPMSPRDEAFMRALLLARMQQQSTAP